MKFVEDTFLSNRCTLKWLLVTLVFGFGVFLTAIVVHRNLTELSKSGAFFIYIRTFTGKIYMEILTITIWRINLFLTNTA